MHGELLDILPNDAAPYVGVIMRGASMHVREIKWLRVVSMVSICARNATLNEHIHLRLRGLCQAQSNIACQHYDLRPKG